MELEDKPLWNDLHGDVAVVSPVEEVQSRERPSVLLTMCSKTQSQPMMPSIFLDLMYTKVALIRMIIEGLSFVT